MSSACGINASAQCFPPLNAAPSGTSSNRSFVDTTWPAEIFQSQTPSVSIATTRSDILAISRLRYELYIERDGKPYQAVDHDKRSFIDAIDHLSLNFQSRRAKVLFSAVRLTRGRDALQDPQTALAIEASGATRLEAISVMSRLIVRPTLSARRSIVPMFQEIYRLGLILGIDHSLLATRLELRNMFERFGFRMTGRCLDDPVAGPLHVLSLDLNDRAHLIKIGSPLIEAGGRVHANV